MLISFRCSQAHEFSTRSEVSLFILYTLPAFWRRDLHMYHTRTPTSCIFVYRSSYLQACHCLRYRYLRCALCPMKGFIVSGTIPGGTFNDVMWSIWKRTERDDALCPLTFRKPSLLLTPGKHCTCAVREITLNSQPLIFRYYCTSRR
jgi:hypothetical protein